MKKRKFLKLLFIAFNVALLFVVLCITAGATDSSVQGLNQPDAVTIKELNIITNHAVLEGQTLQMQVEEFEEFVLLSSVEWSSSNPEVISCSKSGEIKGLKEGKATIKVKAKVGNASDSITVYCARRLKEAKSSKIKNWAAYTTYKPSPWSFQTFHFNIFPVWITGKLEVKGVYGSYFYVEFEREEKRFKGFIPRIWMPDDLASNEIFKQLSVYELDVYVGLDRPHYLLTTNYEGEVKWNVSDDTIIDFNNKTGKIRTLKPGIATISATVGNKTLVCTIHSIYHWPLEWTGAARQATYVYKAVGNTYEETETPLAVGDKFTVKADAGGDSEWAYGANENGVFGYVPISHISTKGTISQYNNMKTTIVVDGKEKKVPWVWPVLNEIDGVSKSKNANYISSPYAPRSDSTSKTIHHRGMDITTGTADEIKKYSVVSAVSGTVKAIRSNIDSCGFCISISSDCIDLVTGQNIAIIYMHLYEAPKYSNGKIVQVGDKISVGTIIGKVGKSNGKPNPDMGYHLHFETNNRNAAVGDDGRSDFTNTINPIYYYLDKSIRINNGSEACKNGYTAYWYNKNK